MDVINSSVTSAGLAPMAPFEIIEPVKQTLPVVFGSPHSGAFYPPDLLSLSRLSLHMLRQSEDSYVDQLFGAAPQLGAPLIKAHYSRVYIDLNREPYELDPRMFADRLPSYTNTRSHRALGGFGTVARLVARGLDIYARKIKFAEVEKRVTNVYNPFHSALQARLASTKETFGHAILLDCHSMPSGAGWGKTSRAVMRPDIVLGDRFGTSCAAGILDHVEQAFRDQGYEVVRNNPYAGGYITEYYGRPDIGLHALQIELNRALYMDEHTLTPHEGFTTLQKDMSEFIAGLAAVKKRAAA